MVLVFASNNKHKLEEVRAMMPAGIEVMSLKEIGFEAEIEETGETLEENSKIKAEAVADYISRQPSAISFQIDGVFADDTGLEIDALDGKPGVYTARWYLMDGEPMNGEAAPNGEKKTEPVKDEKKVFGANRKKALRELEGKEERGAQFRTVITLIHLADGGSQRQDTLQVEGVVRGEIAKEEYGEGGFGYDPVFIPEGYDKTFGELPAEVKNHISHRARALAELVKVLKGEN